MMKSIFEPVCYLHLPRTSNNAEKEVRVALQLFLVLLDVSRGSHTHSEITANFSKGGNLCEFLFALQCLKPLLKDGLKRMWSPASRFFPFRTDPMAERQNIFDSLVFDRSF